MRQGSIQKPTDDGDDALPEAARAWVVRLASGDISAEEMAAFKIWLAADPAHRAMFDRERTRWQGLGALRSQFESPLASAAVRSVPSTRVSMRWRVMPRLAAGLMAACVALVIVLADPYTALRADHATSVGEIARVILPDGSLAVLNTDSALTVDFNDRERGIAVLKGEAWFEVVKNAQRPFRVRASDAVAEAVGTAFGVKNEKERVVVSVTEGIVAVSALKSVDSLSRDRPVRVEHGQAIAYSTANGVEQATPFDAAGALAWRGGRVMIDDEPLSAVIAELDRYRPGKILLLADAAANRHVSGIFSIDKIDQGLEGLAMTHGLTVTRLTPYLIVLH